MPPDRLVEHPRRHTIEARQVFIKQDLFTTEQIDCLFNPLSRYDTLMFIITFVHDRSIVDT